MYTLRTLSIDERREKNIYEQLRKLVNDCYFLYTFTHIETEISSLSRAVRRKKIISPSQKSLLNKVQRT
jgi:hypothetical protein